MIIIGSARMGSNGSIVNDAAGDQMQKITPDYAGEVSMQEFYVHSKGWYIVRPRDVLLASKLADAMSAACNNKNLGYDQNGRYGVIKNGINAATPTECDCSSLVRACIINAAGIDVGDFSTADEKRTILKSDLFIDYGRFKNLEDTPIYNGDILVTATKGHTVIVVSGNDRLHINYYPKYTGSSSSIVDALAAVGVKDTTKAHRAQIAKANQIGNYTGTAIENLQLLALLKKGKLKHE